MENLIVIGMNHYSIWIRPYYFLFNSTDWVTDRYMLK